MSDPAADFAALADALPEPFASEPVEGEYHVGDGGTYACHTAVRFPAGILDVYDVPVGYLALLRGHTPVTWPGWGAIISDTATGAILSTAARAEIDREEDEDHYADLVDEADLPCVIRTREGRPLFTFSLVDDGAYDVAIGHDASGAACALLVYVDAP